MARAMTCGTNLSAHAGVGVGVGGGGGAGSVGGVVCRGLCGVVWRGWSLAQLGKGSPVVWGVTVSATAWEKVVQPVQCVFPHSQELFGPICLGSTVCNNCPGASCTIQEGC